MFSNLRRFSVASASKFRSSSSLTHIQADGGISMVNISEKKATERRAVAQALIKFPDEKSFRSYFDVTNKKGDARLCAKLAGILAAKVISLKEENRKRTADLIPLCHSVPLSHIEIDFDHKPEQNQVIVRCSCSTNFQTGVEMEAMVGATVAAVTIYDMCKALTKSIEIVQVRLIEKTGGKSSTV